MSPTQKKIEDFFVLLGAAVIASVALIALTEVSFRLFSPIDSHTAPTSSIDQTQVPRPYVMSAASKSLKDINTLGYNGKLPRLPKRKSEVRVAIMGASSVFGTPGEKSGLVSELEKELQKTRGRRVQVYNFGIPESIARQNLNRLVLDILPTKPDIVISFNGGTDLTSKEPRVGYPTRFMGYEANPLWSFDISDYPLLKVMLLGSHAFRNLYGDYESLFHGKIRHKGFSAPHKELSWTREKPLNYANALVMMDRLSRLNGSRFIAFFQPYSNNSPDFSSEPENILNWLLSVDKYIKNNSSQLQWISLHDLLEAMNPENQNLSKKEEQKLIVRALTRHLQVNHPDLLLHNTGETP